MAIVIIMGSFAKGPSAWMRLLVPGGHMVVSELCWLRDDPPTEVKAFFEAEGAGRGGTPRVCRRMAAGQEVLP